MSQRTDFVTWVLNLSLLKKAAGMRCDGRIDILQLIQKETTKSAENGAPEFSQNHEDGTLCTGLSQSYEVAKLQREIVAKLVVVRTRAVRRAVLSPIMINIRSELLQCAQSHNVIGLSIHCSCFNCFKGYSTRSVQIQVKGHPLLSPYQNPRLTFQYFFQSNS